MLPDGVTSLSLEERSRPLSWARLDVAVGMGGPGRRGPPHGVTLGVGARLQPLQCPGRGLLHG